MADGTTRAIEDVRVGESVASYDPSTGALVSRRVTETFAHAEGELDEPMLLIDGAILVTANHPFFTAGSWVRADALSPGAEVVEVVAGGEQLATTSRRIRSVVRVPGRPRTFNLEVEGTHDYFAGSLLVHNKLPCVK